MVALASTSSPRAACGCGAATRAAPSVSWYTPPEVFGWCRGSDVDRGTCPECWPTPEHVKPPFRFRPLGRHVFRRPMAASRLGGRRERARRDHPLPAPMGTRPAGSRQLRPRQHRRRARESAVGRDEHHRSVPGPSTAQVSAAVRRADAEPPPVVVRGAAVPEVAAVARGVRVGEARAQGFTGDACASCS